MDLKRHAAWFHAGCFQTCTGYYFVPKIIIHWGLVHSDFIHGGQKYVLVHLHFPFQHTVDLSKHGMTLFNSNQKLNLILDFLKTEKIREANPKAGITSEKQDWVCKNSGCLLALLTTLGCSCFATRKFYLNSIMYWAVKKSSSFHWYFSWIETFKIKSHLISVFTFKNVELLPKKPTLANFGKWA